MTEYTEDQFYDRCDALEELNKIKITRANIGILAKKNILFIEDNDSGSALLMDDKANLYDAFCEYDADIRKPDLFMVVPEYGKTTATSQEYYKAINLGMGHALLIKVELYDEFMKILRSKTKYDDEFEDFYNGYCYWIQSAVELIKNHKKWKLAVFGSN